MCKGMQLLGPSECQVLSRIWGTEEPRGWTPAAGCPRVEVQPPLRAEAEPVGQVLAVEVTV